VAAVSCLRSVQRAEDGHPSAARFGSPELLYQCLKGRGCELVWIVECFIDLPDEKSI